jgi:ribosomal protein L37AE/L43A
MSVCGEMTEKEFKELQEAYDMAMKEINRLRTELEKKEEEGVEEKEIIGRHGRGYARRIFKGEKKFKYTGRIECPYCEDCTDYSYSSEQDEIQTCDKCRRMFSLKMRFFAHKLKGSWIRSMI